MARTGRPRIDAYERWIAGKEQSIIAYCRNGADNAGLARQLGCGLTTIKKLLKNYPEFRNLVKENKEVSDLNVESALYRRALGYEYEETTSKVQISKDGTGTTTEITKTKKFMPPDTTAQIFWLKNRKPNEWRDKQEVDVTVNPFLDLMKAATASDDGE